MIYDEEEIDLEEELETVPVIKREIDYVLIQLVICVIILMSVIVIKLVAPTYIEDISSDYSQIIDKIFLTGDGVINIVNE